MIRIISLALCLFLSFSLYAQSVDTFEKGRYSFYGKLEFQKGSPLSKLYLYPGTTRQYSVSLYLEDKVKAALYHQRIVEVQGRVQLKSKGIQTRVLEAKIVKSVPESFAIKSGFKKIQ